MNTRSVSKNAFLNVLRSVFSLAFPLITYPYATRVLRLTAMGKYNYAESIIGILTLFAVLGVQLYAIREGTKYRDDPKKFRKFASEVFSINLYATIATYVLLLVLTLFVGKLSPYAVILWLLSIRILFTTLSLSWVNTIFEDFAFLTFVTLALDILAIVLLFLFVKGPDDLNKYIIISSIAVNGYGLVMFFYLRRYVHLRFVPFPPAHHWWPILTIFFMELSTVIFVRSDVTLLGWIAGDDPAGLYGLAAQIYRIVKAILFAIIAVILPRFAYHIRSSEVPEILPEEKKTALHSARSLGRYLMHLLFTLCLPAMTGLLFLSRPIVLAFAGAEFAGSARPLALLSVALIFSLFQGFYAQCVLITYRQERYITIVAFASAAVNIVLNIILIPRFAEQAAAFTTILAEAMMLVLCFRKADSLIRIRPALRVLLSSLLGCIPVAVICLLVQRLVSNIFLVLLIAIPLSVVAYFITELCLRNPIAKKVLRAIPFLPR